MPPKTLNCRSSRSNNNGNKDSGSVSRILHRLLSEYPSLRLIKLADKSPSIASVPNSAPVYNVKPNTGALRLVNRMAATRPRQVLLCPNNGRLSINSTPQSIGFENRLPNILRNITGIPLAITNKISAVKRHRPQGKKLSINNGSQKKINAKD